MHPPGQATHKLLVLALSGCLRLLLALNARLLVALSLSEFREHTGLYALSLETAKRAVESLILFYSDFCHLYIPSLRCAKDLLRTMVLYTFLVKLSRASQKNIRNKMKNQSPASLSACVSAAVMVFFMSIAIVIGPTPPGTGVI